MSNNYWDMDNEDDDFDNEQSFSTDGGSDLLKKLRRAKRADEKRIKELTEQLEGLTKVQRERTVKDILEKKGINLKAAKLALKDLEDVNEDTVNGWIEENSDLFGLKSSAPKSPEEEVNRAELRNQDIVTQSAITPDRAEDLEMKLSNAQSAEEILSLLRSQE